MVTPNKIIVFTKLVLLIATAEMLIYGSTYANIPNLYRLLWIVPLFLLVGLTAHLPWTAFPERLGLASAKLKQFSFEWYLLPAASTISFVIGKRAQTNPALSNYWPLFIIWTALLVWVGVWALSSYLPTKEWRWKSLKNRLWPYRWEIAAVIGITLIAFIIRFISVATLPYPFEQDEAIFAVMSQQVNDGLFTNIFSPGMMVAHPMVYRFVIAWLARIFDIYMASRLPSVLLGTLTIPIFYLFLRQMWGRSVAFIGASYLMAYHFHHHYSRIGLENIADPLFVCLTLYFSWRAVNYGKKSDFVLLGLSAGLAAYFYVGGRFLAPFVAFAFIAIAILRHPSFLKNHWADLILLLLALSVAVFPLERYWYGHMTERFSNVGIVQDATQITTIKPTVILNQLIGSFAVFGFRLESAYAVNHYKPPIPLVEWPSLIPFIAGILFSVIYFWQPRNYSLLILFFTTIIIGGALTGAAGSWRVTAAIPAVAAWVAIGIVKIGTANIQNKKKLMTYFIIFTTFLIGYNLWFYFDVYAKNDYYGDSTTRIAQTLGEHVRTLSNDTSVFLYGTPSLYRNHPSMKILTGRRQIYDVFDDGRVDPLPESRASPRIFVFPIYRKNELTIIEATCPGGVLREFDDIHGKFMFNSYEFYNDNECIPESKG